MPHKIRPAVSIGTAGLLAAAALTLTAPAASAHSRARHHHHSTIYVSARAAGHHIRHRDWRHRRHDPCRHAAFSTIQSAVDAARPGATVVVCRGRYAESVTITHRVTLQGMRGAVVEPPSGAPYGIGVAASWSTVRGMTVRNAGPLNTDAGLLADGIVTAGLTPTGPVVADHVRIEDNVLTGNLGSAIDLNSTSYSVARHNVSVGNGVGINVADDLGLPASHNVISHNVTNKNFGGCGIALADHTGEGVTDNLVVHNVSNDNGLGTPTAPDASAGSGVIMASPIAGGIVRDNVIAGNTFNRNGHGGVVVHSHVPNVPNGPQNDFSGNRVVGNRIGTNNLRTDAYDTRTTGIYLGSASPLTIEVSGNRIRGDHYGIFTAGEVTVTGHHNRFIRVHTPMAGVPTF